MRIIYPMVRYLPFKSSIYSKLFIEDLKFRIKFILLSDIFHNLVANIEINIEIPEYIITVKILL